MAAIVIRGAKVFRGGRFQDVEVRCDGPWISRVAPSVDTAGARVIDAGGLHLLPGVIDPQVHFRDPGLTRKEDLETASRACAKGGVTSFLEMPNTLPNATNQREIDNKLNIAARKSRVNYGFFVGATNDNLSDLQEVKRVCGIKVFMGASTGTLLVDDPKALERIFAETDKRRVIALHCEDEALLKQRKPDFEHRTDMRAYSEWRNDEVAANATRLAIQLAHEHGHRAHILHVSTAREADMFKYRDRWVTAEACPHHLFFNVDDYATHGTLLKMNPPLKTRKDNAGLWRALHDGRIQCIATDHAPHLLREKRGGVWQAPAGIPAVENSLALMLDAAHRGLCSLEQVARWMCEAPADIYRIKGRGRVRRGYFADLVLVDANARHTVRNEEQLSKCKWSPWHGTELTGKAVLTVCNGQVVFEDGQVNDGVRGRELTYAQ
jgi:dihydroorotase